MSILSILSTRPRKVCPGHHSGVDKTLSDFVNFDKTLSMIRMLESQIEKNLKKYLKNIGCLCIKLQNCGLKGIPDRLVILPSGKVCFVELKTETGKLSAIQQEIIKQFRQMNQKVYVLYGMKDVRKFVRSVQDEI